MNNLCPYLVDKISGEPVQCMQQECMFFDEKEICNFLISAKKSQLIEKHTESLLRNDEEIKNDLVLIGNNLRENLGEINKILSDKENIIELKDKVEFIKSHSEKLSTELVSFYEYFRKLNDDNIMPTRANQLTTNKKIKDLETSVLELSEYLQKDISILRELAGKDFELKDSFLKTRIDDINNNILDFKKDLENNLIYRENGDLTFIQFIAAFFEKISKHIEVALTKEDIVENIEEIKLQMLENKDFVGDKFNMLIDRGKEFYENIIDKKFEVFEEKMDTIANQVEKTNTILSEGFSAFMEKFDQMLENQKISNSLKEKSISCVEENFDKLHENIKGFADVISEKIINNGEKISANLESFKNEEFNSLITTNKEIKVSLLSISEGLENSLEKQGDTLNDINGYLVDLKNNEEIRQIAFKSEKAEQHNKRGIMLFYSQNFVMAKNEFETALELMPDSIEIMNNLGMALIKLSESEKAKEIYAKVISLEPAFPEAYNNMGIIYKAEGDLENALAKFKQALDLDSTIEDIYVNIAKIYIEKEDYDKAKTYWEKVLEFNSNNDEAKSFFEKYHS